MLNPQKAKRRERKIGTNLFANICEFSSNFSLRLGFAVSLEVVGLCYARQRGECIVFALCLFLTCFVFALFCAVFELYL